MSQPAKILIVDDNPMVLFAMVHLLKSEGYSVLEAKTGEECLALARAEQPDLVLLDVMLPDVNGVELCRQIKAGSDTSQLFVVLLSSIETSPESRVTGLDAGADGYIARPIENRELLARVKALLRRAAPEPGDDEILVFGKLEVDLGARQARLAGQPCDLTSHQFELLTVLAKSPGRVLSRDQIMDTLKGHPLEAFDRSIDVHISRIRAVIEEDPKVPKRVLTVRGAGYVFAKKQDGE